MDEEQFDGAITYGLPLSEDGNDGMLDEPEDQEGEALLETMAVPIPDAHLSRSGLDTLVADYTAAITRRYERGLTVGMHWAAKLEDACYHHEAMLADEAKYDPEAYITAKRRAEEAEEAIQGNLYFAEMEEEAAEDERRALAADEAALAARKAAVRQAQDALRERQEELQAQEDAAAEASLRRRAEKATLASHLSDIQKNIRLLHSQAEKLAIMGAEQRNGPPQNDVNVTTNVSSGVASQKGPGKAVRVPRNRKR